MSEDIKTNIRNVNIWKRALFMVLFGIFYAIAEIVIWAVVIFQFLLVLFTGDKNERLLSFGQNLTTYVYQIVLFLTFNSESHPFPFGDWPDGPPSAEGPVKSVSKQVEPEQVDSSSDDNAGKQAEDEMQAESGQGEQDENDGSNKISGEKDKQDDQK